jgi:hypothetical protein
MVEQIVTPRNSLSTEAKVVEEIVTPRNSLSTEEKPRLTMKFLGVTICSTWVLSYEPSIISIYSINTLPIIIYIKTKHFFMEIIIYTFKQSVVQHFA